MKTLNALLRTASPSGILKNLDSLFGKERNPRGTTPQTRTIALALSAQEEPGMRAFWLSLAGRLSSVLKVRLPIIVAGSASEGLHDFSSLPNVHRIDAGERDRDGIIARLRTVAGDGSALVVVSATLPDAVLTLLADAGFRCASLLPAHPEDTGRNVPTEPDIDHAQPSCFHDRLFDIAAWAGFKVRRISAIVPNYNYAAYLEQRFSSIFGQRYPLYELIVLDDASTDASLDVIRRNQKRSPVPFRLLMNERNSGSVFAQWMRGVEQAAGDYVWICEADDYADVLFLERVMELFDDARVVIAYAQSAQVNERGRLLAGDYLGYTDPISKEKWRHDYCNDGWDELKGAFGIQNTIPNVSGVVFEKAALRAALAACRMDLMKLNVAGDWRIYVELMKQGNIGFIAAPLNYHRRHGKSASKGSPDARQMAEILFMQNMVAGLLPAGENMAQMSAQYSQAAYRHLGLEAKYRRDPASNPEVRRFYLQLDGRVS